MLIDFRVENFRSFREEAVFSMVASSRISGDHAGHCLTLPDSDNSVLRAGVVWGANGGGKSNLFKAMQLAVDLILKGVEPKKNIPFEPFRLDSPAWINPQVLNLDS